MSRLRTVPLAVSFVAVATGTAAYVALPASVFRAASVVAVDEPSPGLRAVAARGAATFAVSKPVIARAATSLNGTDVSAPVPGLADRVGVVFGLSGARSGVARLAEALADSVAVRAGDGIVEIEARADDPARAARIAASMADALVVEEDIATATAARRAEAAASAKTDLLRAAAREAHQRLTALGGTEADPVLAQAAAATATRTAEAHLSAIRAVIAAGNPPLGAGSDLPQSAATLQQAYWDLKRQLDKAAETMGERHTTVIALRDGVSRAAASLTAEWRRIEHAADAETTLARGREASLRKAVAAQDPTKRAAIDEARRSASLADAALARAATTATPAAAPLPFRVVTQAATPASVAGLSTWQRALAAALAGIAAGAALLRLRRREPAADRAPKTKPVPTPVQMPVETPAALGSVAARRPAVAAVSAVTPSSPAAPVRSEPVAPPVPARAVEARHHQGDDFFAEAPHAFDDGYDDFDARTEAMPFESLSFDRADAVDDEPRRGAIDPDLRDALRAIAADLAGLRSHRDIATIMVASNTAGADTGTVALALGEVSAELGWRVLVVECDHAPAALAQSVAPHAEPILVDAFGALRVALPAERTDDLFLAPVLRNGARIAAALARNTETDLVDDLGAVFDAVVIDAGRAADAAAAGWSADAFIRVGRFASQRDDEHFVSQFGMPTETLLGTVAAGRFAAQEAPVQTPARVAPTRPAAAPAGRPVLRAVPGTRGDAAMPPRAPAAASLRVAPRRRQAGR